MNKSLLIKKIVLYFIAVFFFTIAAWDYYGLIFLRYLFIPSGVLGFVFAGLAMVQPLKIEITDTRNSISSLHKPVNPILLIAVGLIFILIAYFANNYDYGSIFWKMMFYPVGIFLFLWGLAGLHKK